MNFGDDRLPPRFWGKCIPEPNSGCWIWLGCDNGSDGYGRIRWGRNMESTHRITYEVVHGLISDGMDVDHLCRVRQCCNPAHLEPVPHVVNCRRGEAGKYLADRTHCPQGHEYNEANTGRVYRDDGSVRQRYCRTCNRARVTEYRLRRAAKAA